MACLQCVCTVLALLHAKKLILCLYSVPSHLWEKIGLLVFLPPDLMEFNAYVSYDWKYLMKPNNKIAPDFMLSLMLYPGNFLTRCCIFAFEFPVCWLFPPCFPIPSVDKNSNKTTYKCVLSGLHFCFYKCDKCFYKLFRSDEKANPDRKSW